MNKCIDCNKKISASHHERCKSCFHKWIWKNPKWRNNIINKLKSKKYSLKTKKLISKRIKEGMTKKVRQKLSKKLKGKHNSPKTEFKKGCISLNKGKKLSKQQKEKLRKINLGKKLTKKTKNKIKSTIHKHHIDLNHKNNKETNFLFLKSSKHIKLHYQGYRYLVKTGQIKKYIKWFDKNYGLKSIERIKK